MAEKDKTVQNGARRQKEAAIPHLVFVSYELYPINAGGCGVLIWHTIRVLLERKDVRITVLLDVPTQEVERFCKDILPTLPQAAYLSVLALEGVLKGSKLELSKDDFKNIYRWKSYLFFKGLQMLHQATHINMVEFFDYVGIGYYSIRAKKYQQSFRNTILAIRAHCTIDMLDAEQVQRDLSPEKIHMYQMEKQAIRDCDCLMVPSKAWGELYTSRYGIVPTRLVISPPPIAEDNGFEYDLASSGRDVLFYGRLFQLKGVDSFVDAAILYLLKNKEKNTVFYVVGYDDTQYVGNSYKDFLLERIPADLRNRFVFTGQVNRKEMHQILKKIRVAVFPNFVESFCYSLHELYNAGVPVILRPIPAFVDYFRDEENALYFDGSATHLAAQIERLIADPDLQRRLSAGPKTYHQTGFIESYEQTLYAPAVKEEKSAKNPLNSKLSILLIRHHAKEGEEAQKIPLAGIKGLPFIHRENSYILWDKPLEKNWRPLYFLGKIYYVSDLQHNRPKSETFPVSQYFWIGNYQDELPIKFFRECHDILKEKETLCYVSSFYKNKADNKKNVCTQHDLEASNPYQFYEGIQRILFRNAGEKTLAELLPFRLGPYGENACLQGEGYTIPALLQRLSVESPADAQDKAYYQKFYLHRQGMADEAMPYVFYPLCKQQKQESAIDAKAPKNLWTRIKKKLKNCVCKPADR